MSEMRINSGGSRERRLTAELAAKDAEIAMLKEETKLAESVSFEISEGNEELRAQIAAKEAEIERLRDRCMLREAALIEREEAEDNLRVEVERLRGLLRKATDALEPFWEAKTDLTDSEAIQARDTLTELKYCRSPP